MDAVLQLNDVIASRHYLLLIGVGISLYLFFTSKSWKLGSVAGQCCRSSQPYSLFCMVMIYFWSIMNATKESLSR
ncbi:hypothetical protein BDQ17DRAFT_116662 [Cyathus striatus]|nr:hypothetical protein BDQ17DRAFT_116662 [Cyathus striatus]